MNKYEYEIVDETPAVKELGLIGYKVIKTWWISDGNEKILKFLMERVAKEQFGLPPRPQSMGYNPKTIIDDDGDEIMEQITTTHFAPIRLRKEKNQRED